MYFSEFDLASVPWGVTSESLGINEGFCIYDIYSGVIIPGVQHVVIATPKLATVASKCKNAVKVGKYLEETFIFLLFIDGEW